jgi:release factor glutamine methyltransferase
MPAGGADSLGGDGEPTAGALLRAGILRLRAAGCELPRLDAELLLGHAAGLDRVSIVAHPEAPIPAAAADRYRTALARRERGEPVAYIRGTKEFMGLTLRVDARALIPRPETERLVELGLEAVQAGLVRLGGRRRLRVVDIGTGSGAVAIAVATDLRRQGRLRDVDILATDHSSAALLLAAENLAAHQLVADVRLAAADLLPADEAAVDVLLANLPYIPTADVPRLPVAASFEPRDALDGGSDGLSGIRSLLERLPEALAPGGSALLEIGYDQAERVAGAVSAALRGWGCRIELDLSGLPRVAIIETPAFDARPGRELERSGMAGDSAVGARGVAQAGR